MRRVLLPLLELTTAQLAGTNSIVSGSGCITWHSSYETTGSATAEYQLWDGPIRGGQKIMDVTLSAGQSTRDYIGLHALPFIASLHLVVLSGAIGGSFTLWVDHVCEDVLNAREALLDLELLKLLGQ